MQVKDRKIEMASHLKTEIVTLRLLPGEDLDENGLCEKFDLSRTPVREVFRELDGLGYIEVRKNRGARVAQLSPEKLRDFFLAAPLIYEAILRLAARNATSTQIGELEKSQRAFCAALETEDVAARALANVRFHEITGEMSANVYLLPSFCRLLIDHARIGMTFYNPRSAELTSSFDTARAQHDEIIRAIRDRDEARAAELAHLHWALSRDQFEVFVAPSGLQGSIGDNEPHKSEEVHANV